MKTAIIVALVLLLGGTGAILLASELGGSHQRLESFDPLFEEDSEGKRVAVEITITSIQSKTKPLEFEGHRIIPNEGAPSLNEPTIRVVYQGDDLIKVERDSQVFVEGRWNKASNTLEATKVSTQCPSRYEGGVKQ